MKDVEVFQWEYYDPARKKRFKTRFKAERGSILLRNRIDCTPIEITREIRRLPEHPGEYDRHSSSDFDERPWIGSKT